jgi:hypothetical protein
MHRLHFKYDYQAAIFENQLRAITPELMAGSTPNFNHRYMYIYWGYFTVSSQEVSTMALVISFVTNKLVDAKHAPLLARWFKTFVYMNRIPIL